MSTEPKSPPEAQSPDSQSLAGDLAAQWQRALQGDAQAQAHWEIDPDGRYGQTDAGGHWIWQANGLALHSSGKEWSSLCWLRLHGATMRQLGPFSVEMSISGDGEAAGFSLGDFKDFLVSLEGGKTHRLRLEIDRGAGSWAFRVDGRLQDRQWWNTAVRSADDLVDGILALKGRSVKHAVFQALAIEVSAEACELSVIITSYRFLQRLRVSLRNWCHQTLPTAGYEVLVVNPDSPDGTHEYLVAVSSSYPEVNLRELLVDGETGRNKGSMINQAVDRSRGRWIWLTDADCVFAPEAAERVLGAVSHQRPALFYGQRRHLTREQTNALLSGRSDALEKFEALVRSATARPPDNAPWGYSQIVHRSTLQRVPYPEQFDHFAHSDSLFIQDCKRHGVMPRPIEGLVCLHLDHPFAWYGTDIFL